MSAALFPVFLKLAGRRVLVVGGGPVATSKIEALVAAGAEITVVAPVMTPGIDTSPVTRHRREFRPEDLEGAWLVVAAATPEVNREVARAAEAHGVFVNAVDDPPNATAYLGGVVRRAGVTLAISTNGHAPALAGLLREALDAVLPADLDRWVDEARAIRPRWIARQVPMADRRPQLLRALNALYARRTWQTYAQEVWL
jgi:uroporphyrin-III C-methyltransferase / precorrin-2 dehydrogenase / sirohydrochlorin ferrochelatase